MVFQGEVLSIGALLERAQAAPAYAPSSEIGVRHTAAANARRCAELLTAGESLDACWRFGILQTLDDYTSTLRRGGPGLAAQVFSEEPTATGSADVDAAFATLADYLAERDGWHVPEWALDRPAAPRVGIPLFRPAGGPTPSVTAPMRSHTAGSSSPDGL